MLLLEGAGADGRAQPLRMNALVSEAKLSFVGSVQDPLHLEGLRGTFQAAGPTLSAAGAPLGVTLPATPKFDLRGRLAAGGDVWNAVVDEARIGSSHLKGAFVFDKRREVPWLSGRVQGSRLALIDLGPAIGHASAAAASTRGRLLPTETFELPTLRVMNANVLFDLNELDLGTSLVAPIQPARAHLTLVGGVLRLENLDLRTAQGRLTGSLVLDSRADPASWQAALDLRRLQLGQFLHLQRSAGDPPYIAGRLDARAATHGARPVGRTDPRRQQRFARRFSGSRFALAPRIEGGRARPGRRHQGAAERRRRAPGPMRGRGSPGAQRNGAPEAAGAQPRRRDALGRRRPVAGR